MTSYLLAGPAEEPVSLVETKAFLKVDDGAEDGLIATLIGAARLHVEAATGKALLAQTWRLVLDRWPDNRAVRLPVVPFINLVEINAVDEAGASHEIALGQFGAEADRLLVPQKVTGMPALQERQGIEIDYIAGFGDEPEDVPADIRQALLLLVAYWHEHRDAAGTGMAAPSGFDRLIAGHKRVRL